MSDISWAHWVDFVSSLKQGPIRWLDIGCFNGALVEKALQQGIDLYCVGATKGALTQESRARTSLALADGLPFSDARFDVISAYGLIEHATDPLLGLKEITRLLKGGGFLLLGAPDPVYLSRCESTIPTNPPPAFWAHHLQQLGYALKVRFFPEPSNLEVLAVKGELSETTEAILEQIKGDCFTRNPDIVAVSDGDLHWALREGWSRLRSKAAKRSIDRRASLYLLNLASHPLQMSVEIKARARRGPRKIHFTIDGWPLKTLDLAVQDSILSLPSVKIGPGGHELELVLEPEGKVIVEGIEIGCEPVSQREFCLELPFDQYQRYKMVQEMADGMRQSKPGPLRVLDVGGHPGQIVSFLPDDEVYVSDVVPCDLPTYAYTDGVTLLFEDESFDVVVSVDTLEHVPPERREGFLGELLRVSRDYLILAGPFADANVSAAERILYDFVKNRLDYAHAFLEEHRKHGLPRWERVKDFLEAEGLRYGTASNGYLYNWLFMMLASSYVQSLPDPGPLMTRLNAFYNSTFYEGDNISPSYRKVVVISKGGGDVEALCRQYARGKGDAASSALKLGLANLFISTIGLEQQKGLRALAEHNFNLEQTVQARDEQIRSLQQHAHNLETTIKEKDFQVIDLKRHLERVTKARDEHIRNLEGVIKARDERIADLEQHARNLEKIREENSRHIADLEAELSEYKRTLFFRLYSALEHFRKE